MPQEHTLARTGNHIRITLDGKAVGLIKSLRGSDDYGPDAVSGIGDIHVLEYVPTIARHSCSAAFVCIKQDLLIRHGFIPENGTAALRGLVFDIEVFDKRGGELIKKYIKCSYASGDVAFEAHAIIMRNVQFNALDTSGLI